MLVWQLLQGHQQQLQGEANAEDTRRENLWQSPSQAKGFIPHPQPPLMDSVPNEAFELFIFPPHHTEDSFNSFELWGTARVADKWSSQSGSICGKTLPLQLSLCQLPRAEEEDDNEEVLMNWSLRWSTGLDFTACSSGLFGTSPTSSGTQRVVKIWQSKCSSPSYHLLLSLLLWWVLPPAHILPPLPVWNTKCR